MTLERLKQAPAMRLGEYADTATYAAGVIHRFMQREAAAMAFHGVFHAQAVMFLGLCLPMWIIRRPPRGGGMPEGAH